MRFAGPSSTPTIAHIASVVARAYDMHADDLVTASRVATVVEPRRITQYLARRIKSASYPLIGRYFGCHHTSVIYNCQQVAEQREHDQQFAAFLDELERAVTDQAAVVPSPPTRTTRVSSLESQVTALLARVDSLERILGAAVRQSVAH